MPTADEPVLNFPLTRKGKAQQRSMSCSISGHIPLNMPQQFVASSSLLTDKHTISTSGNMSFLNNEMVMI
jgi:hypothetical protein